MSMGMGMDMGMDEKLGRQRTLETSNPIKYQPGPAVLVVTAHITGFGYFRKLRDPRSKCGTFCDLAWAIAISYRVYDIHSWRRSHTDESLSRGSPPAPSKVPLYLEEERKWQSIWRIDRLIFFRDLNHAKSRRDSNPFPSFPSSRVPENLKNKKAG